jgi:hypothetical protein
MKLKTRNLLINPLPLVVEIIGIFESSLVMKEVIIALSFDLLSNGKRRHIGEVLPPFHHLRLHKPLLIE